MDLLDRRRFLLGVGACALAPSIARAGTSVVGSVGDAHLMVVIGDGELSVTHEELVAWVEACARAILAWYGRFPVRELTVELTPRPSRSPTSGGVTYGGEHPRIELGIGRAATLPDLYGDWVLVHELTHLAFPSVPAQHRWAEEGLATWLEPWIRVAAGQLSVAQVWRDVVEGLPQGQPRPGDRGLDHTPTWARTYWGGALWCLEAELEVRRQTRGGAGLHHAMRGLVASGGSIHHAWPLERALAAADGSIGVTALTDTWRRLADAPVVVDLHTIWADLGVIPGAEGSVRLDDDAPRAALRRAIEGR